MRSPGRKAIRAWRDFSRFRTLPDERRKIVFYSEGPGYWKYFEAVVQHLLSMGESVAYLTSDFEDPVLGIGGNKRLEAFYIGKGALRTIAFAMLRARVVVLTMPDLNTFHIKRSSACDVHYVYLHHSAVSTHMIYREGAFDHFDSILCVGPHHVEEIRAWEALKRLRPKRLYQHGYGPVDNLMSLSKVVNNPSQNSDRRMNVLIAPSWGSACILERGAAPLVNTLLEAGYKVTVRPHPRTLQLNRKIVRELERTFFGNRFFRIDSDADGFQALIDADVMISDWSGVAMEFAFGLGRPVLFLEYGRKVRNSLWSELGITPLEELYRSEIGVVLDGNQLTDVPRIVIWLIEHAADIAMRAEMLRGRWVFNPGQSGIAGAQIIRELAAEPK
jgi:hypothetical protein